MLGPVVGNFFSSRREFLYEQCSLHMTEKIPSSVKFGSRPRIFLIRSNSSGVRPCFATNSGVTFGLVVGSALVIDPHTVANAPNDTTKRKTQRQISPNTDGVAWV